MKQLGIILILFVFGGTLKATAAPLTWPTNLPVYDHIVIVVEENKNYDEIIGSSVAPYINQLKAEGANFTKMYGEEHNSQGNYFWLFSGDDQDVGFLDVIPDKTNNPNYPFTSMNLGEQLINNGKSFKGYAESLPAIGCTVSQCECSTYARKHVPWISFSNVPNGKTIASSSNLRFVDFPSDYNELPTVSFVIPNLEHDMHNGNPPASVTRADTWLRENLDAYYQWAKTHNSLLILTFDENFNATNEAGLTDPTSTNPVTQNRIATIFAGAQIKPGDYAEGNGITHVNILRTIEAMYGLSKAGAQQPNAVKAGITDDYIITDVFETVK